MNPGLTQENSISTCDNILFLVFASSNSQIKTNIVVAINFSECQDAHATK